MRADPLGAAMPRDAAEKEKAACERHRGADPQAAFGRSNRPASKLAGQRITTSP
jgi:hypothetical protein